MLTLSGQMQQVRLHVLYFMLQNVTVELKHSQDILGESSWYKIAPVYHLADYDTNHWRERTKVCIQRKLFMLVIQQVLISEKWPFYHYDHLVHRQPKMAFTSFI